LTKKELKIVASIIAFTAFSFAGDTEIVPLVPVEDLYDDSSMFIYASGGYSSFDVKDDINSGLIIYPNMLSDESNFWEVGVGYRYAEDIFVTAFLQGAALDEVDVLNLNASINYRFADMAIMPYVGAVVGYSMLEWDKIPVDTMAQDNVKYKLDADGVTLGLQAGLDYELTENFTLFAKYQLMSFDHIMDIFESSDIEHVGLQNVQGGIRYEFK